MRHTLRLSVAVCALVVAAPAHAADPQALAVYEEGKRAYDAGDFTQALAKFDAAAELAPAAARWQYNRGLALKKLSRNDEARAALLKARELEPDYKRTEIDKKLGELGVGAAGPPGSSDGSSPGREPNEPALLIAAFIFFGVVGLGLPVLVIVFIIRGARTKGSRFGPAPTAAQLQELESRHRALGEPLTRAEYALFGREDYPLRTPLELAAAAREKLRRQLESVRDGTESFAAAQATLAEAEGQVALLRALLVDREISAEAKTCRVGCYFCATPLLNEEVRRTVQLEDGAQAYAAVVCAGCEQSLRRRQAPRMAVAIREGSAVHWTEDPGFHPVEARHAPHSVNTAPFWRVSSASTAGQLATAAAAGAVLTGAGLFAAGALDLGALRQSAIATAASAAAARSAGPRERDHS